MREFAVADLNGRGEVELHAPYTYELLEQIPGAIELIAHFSAEIWRGPEQFETILPWTRGLSIRWRAVAPTAGIATLRSRERLTSLCLLVSGLNQPSDAATIGAFQQHLLRELHDTGFEPGFELLNLTDRPLVATTHFAPPQDDEDRHAFALADRCFAAAYFRRLELA